MYRYSYENDNREDEEFLEEKPESQFERTYTKEEWMALRNAILESNTEDSVEDYDQPKIYELQVNKVDSAELWERGLSAIEDNMDAYRTNLQEQGETDEEKIEAMVLREKLNQMQQLSDDIKQNRQ